MADESNITFQVCRKCGSAKPANFGYFRPYGAKDSRMRLTCRICEGYKSEGERAYAPRGEKLTREELRKRNAIRCSQYYHQNKEERLRKIREDRAANPEKYREWDKRNAVKNRGAGSDYEKRRYARRDKDKATEKIRLWRENNPEKVKAAEELRNKRIKERRKSDPEFREYLNKKSREWQRAKRAFDEEFREKRLAHTKAWALRNKEYLRRYYTERSARRRREDIRYRIMNSIRARTRAALKGKHKGASVSTLLGANIDQVKDYIEGLFLPGMTWENWGRGWDGAREWHLDHIKPLAFFDLTDPLQLAEACHYTNLQPLWAEDNLAKGAINVKRNYR